MNDPSLSETDLAHKLLEALRELPLVQALPPTWEIHSPGMGRKVDADIELDVAGRNFRVLVELKKSVYPRDVRETLWSLRQLGPSDTLKHAPSKIILLIAAESMSPGAKELLKKESIGYFDSGGSLFIPAPGAYVLIEKPPPKTFAKTVRSLFKGKRSQVLHALLQNPDEWFSVKALAELAKVSSATASETLSALERFDWISSRGQGPSKERRLSEPGALLDEWAKQATAAREVSFRRYYVPSAAPDALAEHLDSICEARAVDYVLTQEVAAQYYAPFLSSISVVKCRIAPGRAAEAAISELGARVVSEGANLMVSETKSQGEFLFKRREGHVWLASPVQIYLDLLRGGGRAKEMAQHLRKERIGF